VINAAHAVRHLENGQRKGYCKNLSPPRIFKLLHLDACHSKRSVWGRIYLGYLRTDRPKTWYTYVKQKSKTFFVHVNFSKKLKKTRNFLANGQKKGYRRNLSPPRIFKVQHRDTYHSMRKDHI
jgi:hypothetical protein